MNSPREHEWITVGKRRWCMGCDAFQKQKGESGWWTGFAQFSCPRDTPYAKGEDDKKALTRPHSGKER